MTVSDAEGKARTIVVDTDADFDDLIAIAWLLKSKMVTIKAIIYTGTGWSHAPDGAQNICDFLNYMGYKNIPVYLGSSIHLSNTSNISESRRDATDKLWGTPLPNSPLKYHLNGIEQLITLLLNTPDPIDYFCIGPLSTLARAIQKNRSVCKKIAELFVMGAAPHTTIDTSGFTGNGRMDLMATEVVYSQDLMITALSRTTARSLPIDDSFMDMLDSYREHKLIDFFHQMIQRLLKYEKQLGGEGKMFVWDLVAAIIFTFPHLAVKKEEKVHITRNQQGVYTDIVTSKNGNKISVVGSLNKHCNLIDIIFPILITKNINSE